MPKWISEIWDAKKAQERADVGAVIITDRDMGDGKVLVMYPGDKWAELEMKDKIGTLTVESLKDLQNSEAALVEELRKLGTELQVLRADSGKAEEVLVLEGKQSKIRGKLDIIEEQRDFEKARAKAQGIKIDEEVPTMEMSDAEVKEKAEGKKRGRPPKV